jgi:hypothetical protein
VIIFSIYQEYEEKIKQEMAIRLNRRRCKKIRWTQKDNPEIYRHCQKFFCDGNFDNPPCGPAKNGGKLDGIALKGHLCTRGIQGELRTSRGKEFMGKRNKEMK